MLENVLTNYENKHKEYANIIHDSVDNLDSDRTQTGNSSNTNKKNHHLEDDGLEKLVAIKRSIHKSTIISYLVNLLFNIACFFLQMLKHQSLTRGQISLNYGNLRPTLPTANCQLPNANCQMPVANCQMPIAKSKVKVELI